MTARQPAERTHFKELLDTNFLGQWSFKRDPATGRRRKYVLEIEHVSRYKPPRPRTKRCPDCSKDPKCKTCGGKGRVVEPNKRILVQFKGVPKPWLAGPTSQEVLAAMFGPTVQDWYGRKITLYVDETVKMAGVIVGGVRCESKPADGKAVDVPPDEPVDEVVAQQIADAFAAAGVEPGDGG